MQHQEPEGSRPAAKMLDPPCEKCLTAFPNADNSPIHPVPMGPGYRGLVRNLSLSLVRASGRLGSWKIRKDAETAKRAAVS